MECHTGKRLSLLRAGDLVQLGSEVRSELSTRCLEHERKEAPGESGTMSLRALTRCVDQLPNLPEASRYNSQTHAP